MTPTTEPSDNRSYRFPVSVKGVIIRDGRVVLLANERNEWELPGGKLEPVESPEVCLVREIEEELRLEVRVDRLLDAWVYVITPEVRVVIITYGCIETSRREAIRSEEHNDLGWFPLDDVDRLAMPDGYKRSVAAWTRMCSD